MWLLVVLAACGGSGAAPADAAGDGATPVDATDAAVIRSLDALPPMLAAVPPADTLVFAPVTAAGSSLALAYVDHRGAIHALRRTGTQWTPVAVSAESGLALDATQISPVPIAGHGLELAVLRATGEVMTVRDDAATWQVANLTEITGAPLVEPAAPPAESTAGTLLGAPVFGGSVYVGARRRLFRFSGLGTGALSLIETPFAAPGGPIGGGYDDALLYVGPEGTAQGIVADQQAFFDNTMWGKGVIGAGGGGAQCVVYKNNSLELMVSTLAGPPGPLPQAPRPSGDLNGSERRGADPALAVTYVSNGRAVLLERRGLATWSVTDLTTAVGAPAAAGTIVAHYDGNGALLAAYLGTDGHIHLLTRAGTTWTHADLGDAGL